MDIGRRRLKQLFQVGASLRDISTNSVNEIQVNIQAIPNQAPQLGSRKTWNSASSIVGG